MMKIYRTLRMLTVLTVVTLALLTVLIGREAERVSKNQPMAILDGSSPLVMLYEEPDRLSGAAAVLERGLKVQVERIITTDSENWVYINSGETSGWVESTSLKPNVPSSSQD